MANGRESNVNSLVFERLLAHYEALSDDALAAVLAGDPEDRTEIASMALERELQRRNGDRIRSIASAIERARVAKDCRKDGMGAPSTSPDRTPRSKRYARALRIARWIAFIPAAWQAWFLQRLMLAVVGARDYNEMLSEPSNHYLVTGLTSALSSVLAIVVGMWVYPGRSKVAGAVVLGSLMIASQIVGLWVTSHLGVNAPAARLYAVSAFVCMASIAMMVGTLLLLPKRKRSADVFREKKLG